MEFSPIKYILIGVLVIHFSSRFFFQGKSGKIREVNNVSFRTTDSWYSGWNFRYDHGSGKHKEIAEKETVMKEELREMTIFEATMIAEGEYEASEVQQIAAWQLLVDTGTAWQLQGWFGRTATALIEQGIIEPANRR